MENSLFWRYYCRCRSNCSNVRFDAGGTEEAPGDIEIFQGRSYKTRGMGSLAAMSQTSGSSDRYFQEMSAVEKLVPEGIEGRVPAKALRQIYSSNGCGLRSAMGYTGCKNMKEFVKKPRFVKVTAAGVGKAMCTMCRSLKRLQIIPQWQISGMV